jgi:O-antigen ligase
MKFSHTWQRTLKTSLLFCALLFPMFWIVLGGILRTPLLVAGGLLGIMMLWKMRLQRRVRSYASWGVAGLLLAGMGFIRNASESLIIIPVWYILVIFYAVCAGILVAHCAEESREILNWIIGGMMLLFGAWSFLVMQQVDLLTIVRLDAEGGATRTDQRYPVELFGIFSWENVKMQIIPWCAYPLAAIMAVSCRGPLLIRGILLGGAILGAYVAGAFLTRTVFLAGGVAILIIFLVYMIKADRRRRFAMAATVILLALGIVELIHAVPVVNEFVMGLSDRFAATADDGRQYLWASSLQLMLAHPLGGGDALLEEHLWAHNLPLDMGLLYGIPGFLSMTWLLVMLVYSVVKWTQSLRGGIELFEITLLSIFIAALTCSLISPPDISFLTPLILSAAFAKERNWMAASRARARRRPIGAPAMLAPFPAG